jgi:tetratricopeptide (TPR) repeat protein
MLLLVVISTARSHAQGFVSERNSLLQDAGTAISVGDTSRAENDLQSILSGSPHDYQAMDLLGILRAQQRRDSEAQALFQEITKDHPVFAAAHIHLGLLYIQMLQPEKAIAELQEGLRLAPERKDASKALIGIWRDQARTAISSGENEKALSLLLQAKKVSSEDPDLQFELGMVELRMGLLSDAIVSFQKTIELRPEDAMAIYGLGRAFMEHSQFEDARRQFAHYIELRPNDASGHYGLGMTYAALEHSPEARREFETSIALAPVQTESYFRLGVLDLNIHDLDSAANNFQHVIDRDPKHAGALAALGHVEFERKKYEESAELLERAIQSDSSLREAHYYLGLTYARLGKKQQSDEQFQIATKLDQEQLEKQRADLKVLDPETNNVQSK